MSHVCGRPTSEKVLNVSQKQPQRHPAKSPATDSKYFHHCSKSLRQHKLKRLRTRKERSQMTVGWKQTRSCHRHCRCQSKRDVTHLQNCSHNSCHFVSRRSTPVLSAVPTAQEPSIITDSRLIGRHGLFSHEIKSIDIERLLSEQSKHEKRGEKVKKRNTETLHLSPSSHVSAALPGEDLVGADANGEASFINRADSPDKIQDVFVETEEKNPEFMDHESDVTPELTPQQQNNASAGNLKNNTSPKHSSHTVETFKNTNNVISEMDKEPQLTSDREPPRKNQDSQTQTESCNPNSLLDCSSAGETFDMQHEKQDFENVSKSVRALAARLCESLQFPLLKKRNLLEECREGLQKSLQESHGPWLQENLSEVQQCINRHPKRAVHEHREALMEKSQLSCADKSVGLTENKHFNLQWLSSPQPQQSLKRSADWFGTPTSTFMEPLDEAPRLQFSPHFNVDFEPSGILERDLFPHSPTIFQRETVSTSEDWECCFTKSRRQEPFQFNCFESGFLNQTLEARKGSCELEPCGGGILPNQAPLLEGHASEPAVFPDHFGIDSFPVHIYSPPHSRHSQPLRRCREPPPSPAFHSDHTDMKHYPPSYMLERSPEPPRTSSFPSPEHWSFPPMRLY